MKKLDPNKISVEFHNSVTPRSPVMPRKYTLIHSDITGDIFLTIGTTYAYDKINDNRDGVLAEWRNINKRYIFYVHCCVGGDFDIETAEKKYETFKQELPLALEGIRYGDKILFRIHPELDYSPIWVYFDSPFPEFNRVERWKYPIDYE